jgi:hypothetical protein
MPAIETVQIAKDTGWSANSPAGIQVGKSTAISTTPELTVAATVSDIQGSA